MVAILPLRDMAIRSDIAVHAVKGRAPLVARRSGRLPVALRVFQNIQNSRQVLEATSRDTKMYENEERRSRTETNIVIVREDWESGTGSF